MALCGKDSERTHSQIKLWELISGNQLTPMIRSEDSHSGRVRASRTRVDESLEGSNPSSSARFTSLGLISSHGY